MIYIGKAKNKIWWACGPVNNMFAYESNCKTWCL